MLPLATIEDPRVVEHLLIHLGLPSARVRADPTHGPPVPLVADTRHSRASLGLDMRGDAVEGYETYRLGARSGAG